MCVGEYGELPIAVLSWDENTRHLLPLSFAGEVTGDALFDWISRRRIPKNRAYVDEI